jgi:tetratricopeptide (TPR) repeat protein
MIGNCQVQAMAGLHKRFVAGRTRDVIQIVASYRDITEEDRSAIESADLIVEQLFDVKPQVDVGGLATTTPRIFIPMVTATFLWPFAGSPHPRNVSCPFLPGGPYPGEASDSYLNRLILAGVEPEEAVEDYANLDVNNRVKLDRLFEIVLDRQCSRDASADYRIADVIEQHFRTEQIFLSPYHPNVRVATALAAQLFEKLGARRDEIDRMQYCTQITPFPKSELPIHPGVGRHFGINFVTPDRRYRYMNEGSFTFREFALRYMRYEWNEVLEEGMHFVHIGQPEQARQRLLLGLERSPNSAGGYNALGHALARLGAVSDSIIASRRAVELEPEAAPYRAALGNVLRQAGHLDDALIQLRAAVEAEPAEVHYRVLLAHLLRQLGDIKAAVEHMREAIRLEPYSASLQADFSSFVEANGERESAIAALQISVAMEPANESLQQRLAQLLGRLDRIDEAIEIARAAVGLFPESTSARVTLSELLLRNGDPAGAISEAYSAALEKPDSASAYGQLGHVLQLTGDLSAAEAAFRRAAEIAPHNAHFHHAISSVLHQQQRTDAAILSATHATKLEAANPQRFAHLARLLASKGDLPAAQEAQYRAVALKPDDVMLRLALSDFFARARQFDEALAQADIAAQGHPDSVAAWGHLAHVYTLRGETEAAEETVTRALAIHPLDDGLRRQAQEIRARTIIAA